MPLNPSGGIDSGSEGDMRVSTVGGRWQKEPIPFSYRAMVLGPGCNQLCGWVCRPWGVDESTDEDGGKAEGWEEGQREERRSAYRTCVARGAWLGLCKMYMRGWRKP